MTKKKKTARFFIILLGIIFLTAAVAGGLIYFTHQDIRVVKSKHKDGKIKEVWIYKRKNLVKKVKVMEIVYFKNGNVESEIDYKNGAVNGWARLYYKSGKLHVEATYKNNKTHGVRNAYHENGQVFCRAEYENGKLTARKNWDENGNVIYLDMDRP